jgi:hypothetical protein
MKAFSDHCLSFVTNETHEKVIVPSIPANCNFLHPGISKKRNGIATDPGNLEAANRNIDRKRRYNRHPLYKESIFY